MLKLPAYAKALIAAVGSALTALTPYVIHDKWAAFIPAILTVLGVFGYPNAKPANVVSPGNPGSK